jgi:hypothetical protein
VLLATTARPPNAWNISGLLGAGISTIASTPGTASVSLASYDLTVPRTTGQRSIEAYFMPGTATSVVY